MNPAYSPLPTFLGYRRGKGRPGARNYLLVLNLTGLTAPSARHVARDLRGARLVSMPHGTAITGRGEANVTKTIECLARHPNVGAVLVLSAVGKKADALVDRLSDDPRPVVAVTLDTVSRDALSFRIAALRAGAHLLSDISRQQREPFPLSDVMLALECGMSDPTSGLAANPLLGFVTDRLIASGGAAVMGETLEWLGSEDHLAHRAATPGIAKAIRAAVDRREEQARSSGLDLLGNNPNEANIAAGLSTIEDKAVGSVSKSGSGPISSFLDYGERIEGSGLALMDGPSYTPESLTGLVAAGSQVALFTSGVGNSYVSRLAPTIKLTGNATTAGRLTEQFDFACANIMAEPELLEPNATALLDRIAEVASGAMTYGEILLEEDEVISRFGETL